MVMWSCSSFPACRTVPSAASSFSFLGSPVWVTPFDLIVALSQSTMFVSHLSPVYFSTTGQVLWKKILIWWLGTRFLVESNTCGRMGEEARLERKKANYVTQLHTSLRSVSSKSIFIRVFIPKSIPPIPSISVKKHDLWETAFCSGQKLEKPTA